MKKKYLTAVLLFPVLLVFDLLSFVVSICAYLVCTIAVGLWDYLGPILKDEWEKVKNLANIPKTAIQTKGECWWETIQMCSKCKMVAVGTKQKPLKWYTGPTCPECWKKDN